MKHLHMLKLQLFITTYYLQFFWHDMNLKLILEVLFDKWSCSMILSTWSRHLFLKCILVCKFSLSFCKICYVQKSNLWLVLMLAFLPRSCKHCKKFHEKSRDHIHDVILWPHLSKGMLNVISIWWYVKIFANSMYARKLRIAHAQMFQILSIGLWKMVLLNIWSEYQYLVKNPGLFEDTNNI